MSTGTLDDEYLAWLYAQVDQVKTRKSSTTYWDLLRQLYSTEFVWFVPNDDNRAEDGRELRHEWSAECGIELDPDWLALGCSFLELLIGLARRLTFEAEGTTSEWFWHLMGNMGLMGFNDRSGYSREEVAERTSRIIHRTYDRNGQGGLFPLRSADKNQRRVELWYQLSAYLLQER